MSVKTQPLKGYLVNVAQSLVLLLAAAPPIICSSGKPPLVGRDLHRHHLLEESDGAQQVGLASINLERPTFGRRRNTCDNSNWLEVC